MCPVPQGEEAVDQARSSEDHANRLGGKGGGFTEGPPPPGFGLPYTSERAFPLLRLGGP